MAEREEISKLDSTKLEEGQTWFLVEAGWLKHWREVCFTCLLLSTLRHLSFVPCT